MAVNCKWLHLFLLYTVLWTILEALVEVSLIISWLTTRLSCNFATSLVSDQTPYFIGRNLQSTSYPVEMMKWLWSTMKVTFGRWTVFIFITLEFLYYFPLIKHETHPRLRFSVCDKCFSFSADVQVKLVWILSLLNKNLMFDLWIHFHPMTWNSQATRYFVICWPKSVNKTCHAVVDYIGNEGQSSSFSVKPPQRWRR